MSTRSAEVTTLLVDVLEAHGLVAETVRDNAVMTMLTGEYKRTIPVLFAVGERTLAVTSMFATQLDQGHREVFELLLHRNDRARLVHFALDDVGHLVLVGRVPLVAVGDTLLGELLGEILETADSAFNAVLRAGFSDYLQLEQAWRSKVGLPPNPAGGVAESTTAPLD